MNNLSATLEDRLPAVGKRSLGVLSPVLLLLLWEAASGTVVSEFFVSSPSAVYGRLVRWFDDGTAFFHAVFSFRVAAAGFMFGSMIGLTLAVVIGRSIILRISLEPTIRALYAIPRIALAPLFILWLGIGDRMKISFSAVIVFFLVFNSTLTGVKNVPLPLINVLKLLGAGKMQILRVAILPSAAVWFFSGLRVSVPYALVGAVVAELIAGNRGIGFLLRRAQGQFDTDGVFAALILLMGLSLILNFIVSRIESFTMHWSEAQESAVI